MNAGLLLAAALLVVPLSQQGLILNGEVTFNGCVPTSIAIVTDYWHEQHYWLGTQTPQEYLDANAHLFGPRGTSASHFIDDLEELGYTARAVFHADLTTLARDVRRGPTPVLVPEEMEAWGVPHVLVITYVAPGGVVVADPWGGTTDTYPLVKFRRAWAAFGNSYLSIRPGSTRPVGTKGGPQEF